MKPKKKKAKKWNPSPRTLAFLAAIRAFPSITRAAASAGVTRWAHYRRLEREPEYRAAFDTAYQVGINALEDEAIERAQAGVAKYVLYHGKPIMVPANPLKPRGKKVPLLDREYSDSLMLALLKAKKPDEYKERIDHTVKKYEWEGTLAEGMALFREMTMQE